MPRDRRRLLLLLPAIWIVALLVLPAVLWLGGSRQPLLEKRPKEPFPPLSRHTFADPAAIRRFDTAVLDRLPIREQALDLHARLAFDLFHDSTNPDVLIGGDGYLYYLPELATCEPGAEPLGDSADIVDVLSRSLVAAGLRTTVVTVGSKLFTHSKDAPSIDKARERCAHELEQRVEQRLLRTPGGMSIDPELRQLEADGDPTFLRKDTHWNWRGREVFARRVLDRIRPGLAEEAGLTVSDEEHDRPGDLLAMAGREGGERDRDVTATRTPTSPPAPGSVLLIGDSQLDGVFGHGLAETALPGSQLCDWSRVLTGECDAPLRAARTIVLEKVTREMRLLSELCWRPLWALGDRFHGAPARWADADGNPLPGDVLTLPQGAPTAVRVAVSGPDVSETPRLLKLPVQRLARAADGAAVPVRLEQEPNGAPLMPCVTPASYAVGEALFVPVPAGQSVSQLLLRVSGGPDTRLGRPQEVVLDGRPGNRR